MTKTWQQRWSGTRRDACEAGHRWHARRSAPIRLGPGRRHVDDAPAASRDIAFDLTVFDADAYAGEDSYCTGDDELSRSVLLQGCWEPWQTAVAVDVLACRLDGVVLDIGCHVGWYAMLGLVGGHRVLALDADAEHASVCEHNAAVLGAHDRLEVGVGWLDGGTAPLQPDEVGPVRLAKVDVEGMEGAAARVLAPLLDDALVDYALVELSPEFGDGWRGALEVFRSRGYRDHLLADKGADLDAFEWAGALTTTLGLPPAPDDLTVQATVLFERPR